MCAKVDLADVVVAQHGRVSGVGGVVGSAVVDGAAGRKSQAGTQPVLLDEPPGAILQLLAATNRKQQRRAVKDGEHEVGESFDESSAGSFLTRCRSWSSPVLSSS